MAPTPKSQPAVSSNARPKKSPKSLMVTLKLSPKSLAKYEPVAVSKKEIKKEPESKTSSTTSNTLPLSTASPAENGSDSNANTPAPSGTDDSSMMPPPAEGIKKTGKGGAKRTSAQADGLLKPRGKPGPKKKAKLEDGTDSPAPNGKSATSNGIPAYKLGPKANQGAINAGLRALDRTGAPCRKWQKGHFVLKTFTGTVWEIPRWRAPPKLTINGQSGDSASGSSSKENKENSQIDSEKSNSGADVDMGSATSIPAGSPAPVVSAAA